MLDDELDDFLIFLVAFFGLFLLFSLFVENGAFWKTIANAPGDGCSSAPCTALQRRNIVRPIIRAKFIEKKIFRFQHYFEQFNVVIYF